MASYIRRREFLATLGGAAAWRVAARAQPVRCRRCKSPGALRVLPPQPRSPLSLAHIRTSRNARHSTRLARPKRARPRAGAWRSPERSAPFRDRRRICRGCVAHRGPGRWSTTAPLGAGFAGADGDRLALRQKAVRRSHRLRDDNWVILGARCGRNSFSSGTTSVLRAVFASRDEPMASAPELPEATVSGQFVQIFGRKENPRGGDVLVKVRHR